MDVKRLNPSALPKPPAAYSQVVRKGSLVTTAGMVSLDAEGKVVGEGDVGAQTRQVMANLEVALQAVGASLKDVVKTTVFLSDMAHYQGMNAVFNEYFQESPPARSTVQTGLALPSLMVEIEAIAQLDEG
jgi:reactive intermediate/imine deaminase